MSDLDHDQQIANAHALAHQHLSKGELNTPVYGAVIDANLGETCTYLLVKRTDTPTGLSFVGYKCDFSTLDDFSKEGVESFVEKLNGTQSKRKSSKENVKLIEMFIPWNKVYSVQNLSYVGKKNK